MDEADILGLERASCHENKLKNREIREADTRPAQQRQPPKKILAVVGARTSGP